MKPLQQSTVILNQRIRAASETDAARILQDAMDECNCLGQLHFRQLAELTAQRDGLEAVNRILAKAVQELKNHEYSGELKAAADKIAELTKDKERFQTAQKMMIRFLIPWCRHLDSSWITGLMESHEITQDPCGYFIAKNNAISTKE